MKKIKGGYAVKNGYYIKNECKNNETEGTVDDEGYILDPLTYERITEGNIVKLSDGLCYNKSKNLAKNIRKRNSLPFGHPLTIMDEANLPTPSSSSSSLELIPISSSSPSSIVLSESSPPATIPPPPNVPGFRPEWHEHTRTYILRREPTVNRVIEIPSRIIHPSRIVQPSRRGRPPGSRNRPRTNRPRLIIESSSSTIENRSTPDEVRAARRQVLPSPEEVIEIVPSTRRRGRPPGSRNRNSRANTGRGTKKNRKHKKR